MDPCIRVMEVATVTTMVAMAASLLGLGFVAWVLRRLNEWWYVPSRIPAGLKLPEGSMGWPLIGNSLEFTQLFKYDPEAYLDKYFFSRYKDSCRDGIFKAHLFGSPCIITCSPEMNKFVLGSIGEEFLTGWPSPELMGRANMVVMNGMEHKRMRRLILEVTSHPLAIKKASIRLEKRFTQMFAEWTREKTINLREKLKQVVLEDICDSFLSIKPGPLVKTMAKDMEGFVSGMRAYPINIPGFSYYYAMKCRKRLVDIAMSIIKSRQANGVKEEPEDFLDVLLAARDEEGNYLSTVEVRDNIVSFLLGGHESTSIAMMWTMILLAKNPDVLSKLREEHISLTKEGMHTLPDDFKKIPFTKNVLDEVLRVVNISPFMFRKVGQEDQHFKGYFFPKGWTVVPWLRAPHMDSNIFEDPQSFNPSRFEVQTPRLGSFLPFGFGPRLCPGNMLALASARLFIHMLVKGYKWKLVNPDAKITYLPHPKPIDGANVIFETL